MLILTATSRSIGRRNRHRATVAIKTRNALPKVGFGPTRWARLSRRKCRSGGLLLYQRFTRNPSALPIWESSLLSSLHSSPGLSHISPVLFLEVPAPPGSISDGMTSLVKPHRAIKRSGAGEPGVATIIDLE